MILLIHFTIGMIYFTIKNWMLIIKQWLAKDWHAQMPHIKCVTLWRRTVQYLDRKLWFSPWKVELFIELIGQIKKIIHSETVGSASSVKNDKQTEWNELLCKIIILASFTKINQAEHSQKIMIFERQFDMQNKTVPISMVVFYFWKGSENCTNYPR